MKIPKIEKLPSGNYFCRLRLGGVSVPITAATEAECRRRAEYEKAAFLTKKKRFTSASKKTLGEILDDYIESRRNVLSPSTLEGYANIRRNRFKLAMGMSVERINWQKSINNECATVSEKTVRNAFGLICAALSYASIEVPKVRLPARKKPDGAFLDAEQVVRLLDIIRDTEDEIPILLGLHSLRASEIYGLTWDDIDLLNMTITISETVVRGENGYVRKQTTKTMESARIIEIFIPRLAELLAEKQAKRSVQIIDVPQRTLYKHIMRICAENNLPQIGIHGLRRSFASLAFAVGLKERETMQIGGWSDPKIMHEHYIKLSAMQRKKAQEKLTSFFENANENANVSRETR